MKKAKYQKWPPFISAIVLWICATVAFPYLFSTQAFADCGGVSTSIINCDNNATGEESFYGILGWIVRILTIMVGVLAVIGIVIVGIQYLTAKDNEEQVRKAKKRLFNIIIGIIAYVLLATVANFLIPGGFFNDFYRQYVNSDTGEQDNKENAPVENNPIPDNNINRPASEKIKE